MGETPPTNVKDAASALIQSLPDDVSWDEVQYRLYVRQQIEAGLADSDAGRLIDSAEIRRRLADQKENSGMRVRWTYKASADVLAIHADIAEHSETYADAVYARIVDRAGTQVAHYPLSGYGSTYGILAVGTAGLLWQAISNA